MFRVKSEDKHTPNPFWNKPIAKGNHLQRMKTIELNELKVCVPRQNILANGEGPI